MSPNVAFSQGSTTEAYLLPQLVWLSGSGLWRSAEIIWFLSYREETKNHPKWQHHVPKTEVQILTCVAAQVLGKGAGLWHILHLGSVPSGLRGQSLILTISSPRMPGGDRTNVPFGKSVSQSDCFSSLTAFSWWKVHTDILEGGPAGHVSERESAFFSKAIPLLSLPSLHPEARNQSSAAPVCALEKWAHWDWDDFRPHSSGRYSGLRYVNKRRGEWDQDNLNKCIVFTLP